MTDGAVFVVVAAMGGWQLPMTDEGGRLIVFEQPANAAAFAEGLVAAGLSSARIGSVADEEIVAVLDAHDAKPPLTFELEIADGLQAPLQREAAEVYGRSLVPLALASSRLLNPN